MRAAFVLAAALSWAAWLGAPAHADVSSIVIAQAQQEEPERAAPPGEGGDVDIQLRTEIEERAPDVGTGTTSERWYVEPIWVVVGVAGVALVLVVILLSSRGGGGTTILKS